MHWSLIRLYWLRIWGAVLTLGLAMLYLADYMAIALSGFAMMAVAVTLLTRRILNNTLPALCDLCGTRSTIGVEYGPGFSGARLILNCSRCGRVINGRPGSMHPQKE